MLFLQIGPWQRRVIALSDWLYRRLNGLDHPRSQVGPVLRFKIEASRRIMRLADGTVVRRGDRIGVLHLDNQRVVSLHDEGLPPGAIGLEFRRRLLASLAELAMRTDTGGSLANVRAFTATTIHHHALVRLGFEPALGHSRGSAIIGGYQRALLASLHPQGHVRLDAVSRRRAHKLWISCEALRIRFHRSSDLRRVRTPPG
jgi:peptidoglycan-N-acetylglucosamine deacetylase